jgi:predicted alpha/beta hydrolase family esterase
LVSNKDIFEDEFEKLSKNEQFSKRVNLANPGEVATKLLMEVNEYSCQLFSLWNEYIQLLMIDQSETVAYFKPQYHKLTYERWCESIFRDINVKTDFYHCSDSAKVGDKHMKIATKQRNSSHYQNLTPLPIEDTSMFPDWSDHPILFEECYIKDKKKFDKDELKRTEIELTNLIDRNNKESHLIILVHGFQGNSEDLRLLRNNLLAIYPAAIFLSSTCNENESDMNIEDQGLKLANEVTSYIENYFETDEIKRVSFIGHSLGGIIIRASLPYLEELKDKLYTYMSLSSPHLGYLYSPKFLVSAGMWVLKKWKKSESLKELSMSDANTMEESYLFRLSEISKLEWFKNIVLVSSFQDSYVAFESARMQFRKEENTEKPSSAKNKVYEQMAKNLLANVPSNVVYRLDVNFKIQEKNLDSFIGRAAHIRFLENQPLMRMIVSRYAEFFA